MKSLFLMPLFVTMVTGTSVFEIPDNCLGDQAHAINYHEPYLTDFNAWIVSIGATTFVVGHETGIGNAPPIKILGRLIGWRKISMGVEYTYAQIKPECKEVREKILTSIKKKNENREVRF